MNLLFIGVIDLEINRKVILGAIVVEIIDLRADGNTTKSLDASQRFWQSPQHPKSLQPHHQIPPETLLLGSKLKEIRCHLCNFEDRLITRKL